MFNHLLTALQHWTETLKRGISVDVLYLNFSRAFDYASVQHERLLLKLKLYAYREVCCSGLLRNEIGNGVKFLVVCQPQGSVIDSLLFLINNLPNPSVAIVNQVTFNWNGKISYH